MNADGAGVLNRFRAGQAPPGRIVDFRTDAQPERAIDAGGYERSGNRALVKAMYCEDREDRKASIPPNHRRSDESFASFAVIAVFAIQLSQPHSLSGAMEDKLTSPQLPRLRPLPV
jgi:hypothetical protein